MEFPGHPRRPPSGGGPISTMLTSAPWTSADYHLAAMGRKSILGVQGFRIAVLSLGFLAIQLQMWVVGSKVTDEMRSCKVHRCGLACCCLLCCFVTYELRPFGGLKRDRSYEATLCCDISSYQLLSGVCRHLAMGRLAIIVVPVVGMLPLLSNPTALDATTTSGTGRACSNSNNPLTPHPVSTSARLLSSLFPRSPTVV